MLSTDDDFPLPRIPAYFRKLLCVCMWIHPQGKSCAEAKFGTSACSQ